MIDHHHYYRKGHHRKRYHQFQNYITKYIDHFESCPMYQNHELFQDFVHFRIECEEKTKVLRDNMESNDCHLCEVFFRLVSEVHA